MAVPVSNPGLTNTFAAHDGTATHSSTDAALTLQHAKIRFITRSPQEEGIVAALARSLATTNHPLQQTNSYQSCKKTFAEQFQDKNCRNDCQ
jgi:hypothetical protein